MGCTDIGIGKSEFVTKTQFLLPQKNEEKKTIVILVRFFLLLSLRIKILQSYEK